MDLIDQNLLFELQRDFPIAVRPFAVLAERLDVTESEVIERTQRFFDEGKARRFGAVFDASGVGYRSALCGVMVPESEVDTVAAAICPHIGVTHCYTRDWPTALDRSLAGCPTQPLPNLWFTLAAHADRFEEELAKIQAHFPYPILALPALQRFKIDVVFDPRKAGGPAKAAAPIRTVTDPLDPSNVEQLIISQLQQNLPVVARPFAAIAEAAGLTDEALIERMLEWKERGALRRIALILFHRKVGFKANAMCVWNVPKDQIAAAGKLLAARPEITHCYERELIPEFPFNMYAMIHRATWDQTHELFTELSEVVGNCPANLLGSIRELKKASPHYFGEVR